MDLLTIGGDLRYAHMLRLAAESTLEMAGVGLEKSPFSLPCASLQDISAARAILLPNPFRSGMSMPFAEHAFTLEEVLDRIQPGTPLLMPDTVGMGEAPQGVKLIDLSLDEEYVLQNAHLTAEGAVCAAMGMADGALMGSRCLVIGYGRIARRLTKLLLALNASVSVCARREQAREMATCEGADAFNMEALEKLLPRAQFVFSTPPARVLFEELLQLIDHSAVLMDLASPPFGFDLDKARALGLKAARESGLPGRYCPRSAGAVLLDAVLRALTGLSKEEVTCI